MFTSSRGSVWKSAAFGTQRSQVRILSRRLKILPHTCVREYFCSCNYSNLRPLTGSDTPFGRRGSTRSGGPRPGPTGAERRPTRSGGPRPGPTGAERRPTRSGEPRPGPTEAERRPQIQLSLVQSRAERRKFSPIPIITNTVEIFITCWKLNILFTV